MAVALFTACSGEPVNQGPELRGVKDVTCLANTTVDLLDGVAALDVEDGDITPDLKITVTPEVDVENGYATFTQAGEYEVRYEVYDSLGKLARTTVSATVKEREVYSDNTLTNGFSVRTGGGVKVVNNGLNGSVYAFNATGCEIAEDLQLTRTYALITGVEYTFKYFFECNGYGRMKVAADGKAIKELNLNAGDRELQFTYSLPLSQTADGEAATDTVEIALWLGGLGENLQFSLSKAETAYWREDGESELAENFNFGDKIINRDGKAQAVYASEDGKSATLEVTQPTGVIWQVGMFINTGIRLEAGDEYTISFDIDSKLGNDYQICIQKHQWNEEGMRILESPQGHVSETVTATEVFSGDLWLFIRSGVNQNNITISDFSVKVKKSGYKTQSYSIGQVYSNSGSARCEYGKIVYEIGAFGSDWGNNELGTPSFELSGAAGNFVITFTAKATSPVSCVFAASLADRWDTFVWKQLKLSTEQQTYSIRCDDKGVEGLYKFIWQFGTSSNAIYGNVTVEISDIKICYLSDLEG